MLITYYLLNIRKGPIYIYIYIYSFISTIKLGYDVQYLTHWRTYSPYNQRPFSVVRKTYKQSALTTHDKWYVWSIHQCSGCRCFIFLPWGMRRSGNASTGYDTYCESFSYHQISGKKPKSYVVHYSYLSMGILKYKKTIIYVRLYNNSCKHLCGS